MSSKHKNKAVKNLSPGDCKTYQNSSIHSCGVSDSEIRLFTIKMLYYKKLMNHFLNKSESKLAENQR